MSSGCYGLIGVIVQLSTGGARQAFCSASNFCRKPRDGDAIEISIERKSALGLGRKVQSPRLLNPPPESTKHVQTSPSFTLVSLFSGGTYILVLHLSCIFKDPKHTTVYIFF